MRRFHRTAIAALLSGAAATGLCGQQAPPIALTLKRTLELALQNSKDIKIARIQASVADRAAMISKADFLPNLYAGSGAGYTYGIPETPGGRAPSIFNVTYTEQVFNLNGIGKLLVDAVVRRDYTMTQALIMLIAGAFVVTNFVIDLLYVFLDPRISYS